MTTSSQAVNRRGVLIALTGTVIWAMTGVFIDYLLSNYPLAPLTLAFWRDLCASLALFVLLGLWRPRYLRIRRSDLPFLLFYGAGVLALFNSLWTFSVKFNGGAVGTVLAYSSPAFIVLLARPLLGERLTARRLLAVALSITGCIFVSRAYSPEAWQVNPLGIVIGLASGVGFAIYTLAGRWGEGRFPSGITMMPYAFLFASMTLGVLAVTTGGPASLFTLGTRWDGWGVLALLAVGPTIGGYGLYAVSLRYLEASVAGLIASLEPAFTAVMALFVLGRWLNLEQWGGTALILTAVVLVQASRSAKPSEATVP